ncbi:hypothetical protein [uncultured Shimia sp.]|uniref:hypothetical protein n=1 Tax=uncultured Shimia sp. TaxID=573152 RepID=UPI00262848CD|nr:hypothetical protein [uncultured Shimia sp.]
MTETENEPWSVLKLAIWLYPVSALTVAFNLFLLGLMWQTIGWPVVQPIDAILWSLPLGIPATWLFARWMRGLMDEADGRK